MFLNQDAPVLSRTVYENLAVGESETTRQEILRAVFTACVDEFLTVWPNGLDTKIGKQSFALSGGQRQRVAIARALVRSALGVDLLKRRISAQAFAAWGCQRRRNLRDSRDFPAGVRNRAAKVWIICGRSLWRRDPMDASKKPPAAQAAWSRTGKNSGPHCLRPRLQPTRRVRRCKPACWRSNAA